MGADQLVKIDWEQLRSAQEALAELRRLGVEPKGYDLVSPYERRPLKLVGGRHG